MAAGGGFDPLQRAAPPAQRGVASGLEYAHRKADGHGRPPGIVPCDVSPSNVGHR
jgi:hypothetical protein